MSILEGSPHEPETRYLVDAHQDIACHCQELQRDLVDPGETPCMITLPWLQEAGVRLVFATLFTPHEPPEPVRRTKLEEQYRLYERWFQEHEDSLRPIKTKADLHSLKHESNHGLEAGPTQSVGVVFLMEGCDLLERPSDMEHWFERGVRLASLTWNGMNRFASGCLSGGGGLTYLGRELLSVMEQLGVVLDLSHLSDRGAYEALELYGDTVCATHSNFRGLCNHERNLPEDLVAEIGKRDGVVGLNLLATFIREGWVPGAALPSVAQAAAHSVAIAEIAGWHCVGLGSDLDGGLTPQNTPEGINTVKDLHLVLDALEQLAVPECFLRGFRGRNWLRLLEHCLPD